MSHYLYKSSQCILADADFAIVGMNGDRVVRRMQILRTGSFYDERYGEFDITKAMLDQMVKNFSEGVRGVIPALDYSHKSEDIAAGWFKTLFTEVSENGTALMADIEMNPKGNQVLSDKEFGYISADFDGEYIDNESGKKYGFVLLGAGLTNRPVIKRMKSVVELSEKTKGENMQNDKTKAPVDKPTPPPTMAPAGSGKDGEPDAAAKKLSGYTKLEEMMGSEDPEAIAKMIQDLKSRIQELEGANSSEESAEKDEENKQMAATLAEANKKIKALEDESAKSKKEKEFSKLLSENKAVEAQREAFIAGDMAKFASLSHSVNAEAAGTTTGGNASGKDAEDEILAKAKILADEKKIEMKDAISEVLSTNKALAEKVRNRN